MTRAVRRPAWSHTFAKGQTEEVIPKGGRFYLGTAKAWCYLCRSEHRATEEHLGPVRPRRPDPEEA